MKICKNCGKEFGNEFKYCSFCGNKLIEQNIYGDKKIGFFANIKNENILHRWFLFVPIFLGVVCFFSLYSEGWYFEPEGLYIIANILVMLECGYFAIKGYLYETHYKKIYFRPVIFGLLMIFFCPFLSLELKVKYWKLLYLLFIIFATVNLFSLNISSIIGKLSKKNI